MSGTSLDGVDVCWIETDGASHVVQKGHFYQVYPVSLRQRLAVVAKGDVPLSDVLRLEKDVTDFYGDVLAASRFLLPSNGAGIHVVGCHGQTIRHLPDEGLTWQLGDVNRLTERVQALAGRGVPVVMDFRRRDMAAGGEGAPLVPLFHAELVAALPKPVVILNIGGVANVSVVQEDGTIRGSDCGPGMGLLDAFMAARTGQLFDDNGATSLQGVPDAAVVAQAMALPFFTRPLPRSADRYAFDGVLPLLAGSSVPDGAATLVAITAEGIHTTLVAMGMTPAQVKAVIPVGGGARNAALLAMLADKGWALQGADALGWSLSSVEAACFAWLAVRRMVGVPTSIPQTTGARHATVGGVMGFVV